MSDTSTVNLSQKIDPATVRVLRIVSEVCAELGIPWVVVGATARDMLLHFGYGAKIRRATHDIDFAIEVADWGTFEKVKQHLVKQGFRDSKVQHRLFGPNDDAIDIVPFGQLENENSVIEWPPKGEVSMNVLGFSEACEHAERIIVCDESNLSVPVTTPVGMMLLKLIAWTDRAPDIRKKDATDIKYIIENYEIIPKVFDELYEKKNVPTMERYDWDLTLASAHLLGEHTCKIAAKATIEVVDALINGDLKNRSIESLVFEMSNHGPDQDRDKKVIDAFLAGFKGE